MSCGCWPQHTTGSYAKEVRETGVRRVTRILVSGLTDNPGGVETVVLRYLTHFPEDIRFDVWVSAERCAFEDDLKAAGCGVFHGRRYSKGLAAARRDMEDFFKERGSDYDVLWSNKSMLVNPDDLRLARRAGIKRRILHAHNSRAMFPGARGLAKAALHRANRLRVPGLATDYWACSDGAGYYFFTPSVRRSPGFRTVRNALDPGRYRFDPTRRAAVRCALGIEESVPTVGFVGRLQYQKNPQFLIEAFGAYNRTDPSSVLLVAGDGDLRAECEQMSNLAGLDSAVRFLGVRNDVEELYQAFDLLLLPSRFEGLSVAAIEAQAAGLPVIASDTVPRETAVTELMRFLPVDHGAEEWVSQMAELLRQRDGRADITVDLAARGYDIQVETKRLASILTGVVL